MMVLSAKGGMLVGLREEYDQAVSEKNARRKREEEVRSWDALLCDEVRALYERCPDKKLDGMYHYSLPIPLPPEAGSLIQELIELCPPGAWKTVPATAEMAWVRSDRKFSGSKVFRYETGFHYLQYRLADGSTHIGSFALHLEEPLVCVRTPYRFTLKGQIAAREAAERERERLTKELVLQKAQQALDETITRNPLLAGSREYIKIQFRESSDTYWNVIVIFRDGTVYDPYPMRQGEDRFSRPLASPAGVPFLREKCSQLVRQWAAMA